MKTMRSPSHMLNFVVLVGLFSLIFVTYKIGMHVLTEPAVDQETQLSLEDHNQSVPLEESEAVALPPAPVAAPVTAAPVGAALAGAALAEAPKPQAAPAKAASTHKKIVELYRKPLSDKPDPFTDGGPLDLDRTDLGTKKVDQQGSAEVYQLARTSPKSRDYFIPFEKQ